LEVAPPGYATIVVFFVGVRELFNGVLRRGDLRRFLRGRLRLRRARISLGELEDVPVYTADVKLLKRVGGKVLRHISGYESP